MKTIVIYKTKYGATKTYAEWIAEDLKCDIKDCKKVKADELLNYDTIIFGGGLYAEKVSGVSIITNNFEKLKDKNLIVFTTGMTPVDCREYYDGMIAKRTFKPEVLEKVKIFNYRGKMIYEELTYSHKMGMKALENYVKKIKNPTDLEKVLINICNVYGDFTDRNAIKELVDYVNNLDRM